VSPGVSINLSHKELSLLLFALEGGPEATAAGADSPVSCEDACPVVEKLEEALGGRAVPHEKRLAHHLNDHMREALFECGFIDVMAASRGQLDALSGEDRAKLRQVNERLSAWHCEIKLDGADRLKLSEALSRLPRSAWLTMPRTLWRLRKKLRAG
jgi:hypothetical protein